MAKKKSVFNVKKGFKKIQKILKRDQLNENTYITHFSSY